MHPLLPFENHFRPIARYQIAGEDQPSRLLSSLNCARLTGVSLINALDFPFTAISLLNTSSSSASKFIIFKKISYTLLLSALKTPSTMHFFSLFTNADESALSPRINPNAPTIMDLPAPVSPVMTFTSLRKFNINSINDGIILNRKLFQHELQFK